MQPTEPKEGRYADMEWATEHSDVIKCVECGGPVQFKDWEDDNGRFVATHYRCPECRLDWWADG